MHITQSDVLAVKAKVSAECSGDRLGCVGCTQSGNHQTDWARAECPGLSAFPAGVHRQIDRPDCGFVAGCFVLEIEAELPQRDDSKVKRCGLRRRGIWTRRQVRASISMTQERDVRMYQFKLSDL